MVTCRLRVIFAQLAGYVFAGYVFSGHWGVSLVCAADTVPTAASDVVATDGLVAGDPAIGYQLLVNQAYLPPDFEQVVFDHVWQVWPEPLRREAASATPAQRRQMAFDRYGLTSRPETPADQLPGPSLQYVVSEPDGPNPQWTMNCFSCHGGTVYGQPYPGAPNNRFALQTMSDEIRSLKIRKLRPLTRMDLGSAVIPLGETHGTTNSVIFGVGLMSRRDADLNNVKRTPAKLVHHDLDAPPWWHFSKRPDLYIDGFAKRGHRGLMQFTLVPENDASFFRRHEQDFLHVYAYLMSLTPPQYPHTIDEKLAEQGHHLFNRNCADCHGTYGADSHYPSVRVPIDELGTDPARLQALSPEGRAKYAASWFAINRDGSRQETTIDPDGYVAPPLDGVWASAPYFHNGSVPTLWDVLNPAERPSIWRRTADEMDETKIGLTIETVDQIPATATDIALRRQYFDTSRFGKSNAGHGYPDALTEPQKRAVLEYLKTL